MRISVSFITGVLAIAGATAHGLYERDASDDQPALVARAAYADAYHELLEAREAYDDAYEGYLAARDEHSLAARGNNPSISQPGGKAKGKMYICLACKKQEISQKDINGTPHKGCPKPHSRSGPSLWSHKAN